MNLVKYIFDSVYYTDLASKIAELIKEELEKGTKAEEQGNSMVYAVDSGNYAYYPHSV